MKFGYARVSKNDQSLEIQIQKLTAAGCNEIFKEKVSGAKDERTQLNHLISKLRKGDIICVVRLDRLGRRMTKLIELINDFKEKGIEFVSLENNIDTTTPMGMVLFTVCAAFSEMERELIKERVKAGLEAAHSKGRKGGRPKALTIDKLKKLKSLTKSEDFSITEICHMVGISRSVYYRAITDELAK
jgi:DNA invertase Pin-like site-specific DNA recombinase